MKKIIFLVFPLIFLCTDIYADAHPLALGAGFHAGAGSTGFEWAVSHSWDGVNRGEGTFGYSWNGDLDLEWSMLDVNLMYQWYWNINDGFNFFAGPLVGLGVFWQEELMRLNYPPFLPYLQTKTGMYFGVGGQIGLEYDFDYIDVPLIISTDIRPVMNLLGSSRMDSFFFVINIGVKWIIHLDDY